MRPRGQGIAGKGLIERAPHNGAINPASSPAGWNRDTATTPGPAWVPTTGPTSAWISSLTVEGLADQLLQAVGPGGGVAVADPGDHRPPGIDPAFQDLQHARVRRAPAAHAVDGGDLASTTPRIGLIPSRPAEQRPRPADAAAAGQVLQGVDHEEGMDARRHSGRRRRISAAVSLRAAMRAAKRARRPRPRLTWPVDHLDGGGRPAALLRRTAQGGAGAGVLERLRQPRREVDARPRRGPGQPLADSGGRSSPRAGGLDAGWAPLRRSRP